MAKKEKAFEQINTGRVYNTIAEATAEPEQAQEVHEEPAAQDAPQKRKARKTYTAEETLAFKESLRTTGRKGVKLPRINLAFAPDIYEFILTMSRVRGETMTQFVNVMLRQGMADYEDVYKKAQEFKNSL